MKHLMIIKLLLTYDFIDFIRIIRLAASKTSLSRSLYSTLVTFPFTPLELRLVWQ